MSILDKNKNSGCFLIAIILSFVVGILLINFSGAGKNKKVNTANISSNTNNNNTTQKESNLDDTTKKKTVLPQYKPNDEFYKNFKAYTIELKRTAKNSLAEAEANNNYLLNAATNDGKIHTFKKNSILIYVPENKYYDVVHRAFVAYNYQFEGYLLFQSTKNPDKTDIRIVFTDSLKDKIDDDKVIGLGGVKRYDKDGNIIYSELAVLDKKIDAESPSLTYIYNILLHEIGHCIGISGHSSSSEDVMYKSASPNAKTKISKFSKRDIETIKLMYSGNKEVLDDLLKNAKSVKLNENISYAKENSSSDSYIKVADSYFSMGKYEQAISAYKKAIEINPNNSRIYLHMGDSYYKTKQYPEAIDSFKQGLKIDPVNSSLYLGLAECYTDTNDYDVAIMYSKMALDNASSKEEKLIATGIIAYAYSMNEDYKSAINYHKELLEEDSKNRDNFFNYIISCYYLNKKDLAKEAYNTYFGNYDSSNLSEDEEKLLKWLK